MAAPAAAVSVTAASPPPGRVEVAGAGGSGGLGGGVDVIDTGVKERSNPFDPSSNRSSLYAKGVMGFAVVLTIASLAVLLLAIICYVKNLNWLGSKDSLISIKIAMGVTTVVGLIVLACLCRASRARANPVGMIDLDAGSTGLARKRDGDGSHDEKGVAPGGGRKDAN